MPQTSPARRALPGCNTVVGVIGPSYVGQPVAAVDASFKTVGFDIDTRRIDELHRLIDATREVVADEFAGAR